MIFVALFGLNAVLSFALSLVLSGLLGPAEFGRYALALAVATALNTILFEWLRLATTRHLGAAPSSERAEVAATLRRGYAGASAALAVLGGSALVIAAISGGSGDIGWQLLAATAAAALGLGFVERGAAIARALFRDGAYARLLGIRAIAAFALATGAAALTGSAFAALAASAVAAGLALLAARSTLATEAGGRPSPAVLRGFARYALPLVAAGAIYQLMPVLNRGVLAARSGFAEAGTFALASEIGYRLFQNLGAALDVALFQLAIREEARHGREAATAQLRRNLAVIAAMLLPAAAGLVAVLPSFEAVFVPGEYRDRIDPALVATVPALACFALAQYGIAPLFQLGGRTVPAVLAALLGLVADATLLLAWPGPLTATAVALAQLAGMAAALAALGVVALASGLPLPIRDLALGTAASAVMLACVWPLRQLGASAGTLALQVGLGLALYTAAAWLTDLAGMRTLGRRATARAGLQPK